MRAKLLTDRLRRFLKLRLNTGHEEERARDLFLAMWIPDLFMKVRSDGTSPIDRTMRREITGSLTARRARRVVESDVPARVSRPRGLLGRAVRAAVCQVRDTSIQRDAKKLCSQCVFCASCRYEKEGRAKSTVKARDVWKHIITSQVETGLPYMVYKVRRVR